MNSVMTDSEGLEAALDQMYDRLLTGTFTDFAKIVVETERLLGAMPHISDRAVVARLRKKADRNGQCLLAAGRGLRAAQRRIVEMGQTGARLSTYTRTGARTEISTSAGALTQRL